MNGKDLDIDTSRVTQAQADWAAKSWVDFTWAQGSCPDSYEALGNEWLGTNPGNYS